MAWLRARAPHAGAEAKPDYESVALIVIESMSAYREMRSLLGRVPGDVGDERFIATWVELGMAWSARYRPAE